MFGTPGTYISALSVRLWRRAGTFRLWHSFAFFSQRKQGEICWKVGASKNAGADVFVKYFLLRRAVYTFCNPRRFMRFCKKQNLKQPLSRTKKVCAAKVRSADLFRAAVVKKCLRKLAQSLFNACGYKRYNTLDFPDGKSCAKRNAVPFGYPANRTVCPIGWPDQEDCLSFWKTWPTGRLSPLLDYPEPKRVTPSLETPVFAQFDFLISICICNCAKMKNKHLHLFCKNVFFIKSFITAKW